MGQVGKQAGDLPVLEKIHQAHEDRLHFVVAGHNGQVGNGVHDYRAGLKFVDQLVDHGQVHLQAVEGGTGGMEFEYSLFDPGLQVKPDGAHVADDLVLGFLQGQVEATLAPAAGGVGEVSRQGGLAAAGSAGDQDAAAPVIPLAAQHAIQAEDAGGDAFAGDFVIQP